jgi:MerR family transcriptional regulator, light-induced transcriptional regulator
MSVIRTNAAAAMLGVSPNTLRSWERRFSYPTPRRTDGGHRQFELTEIQALRQAFQETHNISSAVSIARERGECLTSPARLRDAFAAFDQQTADRLLEESLALRSVERTVESMLLAAVASLEEPLEEGITPEYGFAWRYATGWLAAAQRVAPPATREQGVMIFDASRPPDIDALYIQAFELVLRRAGLRVLSLPVELDPVRLARALRALRPSALVLSGERASMDALGRLVYAARQSNDLEHPIAVEVFDYRGALSNTGASTVPRLGSEPEAAASMLRERLLNGAPAISVRRQTAESARAS